MKVDWTSHSYKDLLESISKGRIIVVVGAGVSQSVAKLPGWRSACESAIEHAFVYDLIDNTRRDELRRALDQSTKSQEILAIAEDIRRTLSMENGAGGEFTTWLRLTFQIPLSKQTSTKLVDLIHLINPGFIATTNYDRILSTILNGSHAVNWTDYSQMLNAIRVNESAVGHLHGIFDYPSSVIWGLSDYERQLADESIQQIMRLLWVDRTLLFVGCSTDGVTDPSFATLVKWCSQHFPDLNHKHFVLVRSGEVNREQKGSLLRDNRLQVVEYGDNHQELPTFLELLTTKVRELQAQLPLGDHRTTSPRHSISDELALTVEEKEFGKPPIKVRHFYGNSGHLARLAAISGREHKGSPYTAAIVGMSGSGKSQLALEFLTRNTRDYDLIWWIDSQSVGAMDSSLAALCSSLNLPADKLVDQKSKSAAAIEWLGKNDKWLIIFDDARPDTIRPFIPSTGDGTILITSTNPNWSTLADESFLIRGLDEKDSLSFLKDRLGTVDIISANRISSRLGGLPLALEQVASYIERTRIGLEEYEVLLDSSPSEVLDEPSVFTDYPASVYSTIHLNVNLVHSNIGNGIAILMYLAFCLPRNFPREIVAREVRLILEHSDELYSDHKFNMFLAELAQYSLIELDESSVSVHPLVQSFIRDSMEPEVLDGWVFAVLSSLSEAFPPDVEDSANWQLCEVLIDHVLNVMVLARGRAWGNPEIQALYSSSGHFEHIRKNDESAALLHETALEFASSTYGSESPEAALLMNNLLVTYHQLGRTREAIELGEKGVAILENHKQTDDSYVNGLGIILSNLGRVYLDPSQRHERARELFKEALGIHQALHGQTHSACAIDLNNIGTTYRADAISAARSHLIGKSQLLWAMARDYFHQAVLTHRKVRDHKDYRLAIALYNLGQAENNIGNYNEADTCLFQSIRILEALPLRTAREDLRAAYFGHACNLSVLGKTSLAQEQFAKAHQLQTTSEEVVPMSNHTSDQVAGFWRLKQ